MIAIIITVQAICLGFVSVVSATESARPLAGARVSDGTVNTQLAGRLNDRIYTATHSRSGWLYDLMTGAGYEVDADRNNAKAVYALARKYGMIGTYDERDPYLPVNRRFIAYTMVKALGYKDKDAGFLFDVSEEEGYLSTMVYYGYFIPDDASCVNPDAVITPDEYDALLIELERYRQLKGKRLLSFGDSIMYGAGNSGEGIADMIAQKYGMINSDYSVSGATFGESKGRAHIADQIRRAAGDKKKADVILINGGTNDVNHTTLGAESAGFDMSKSDETTFSGGFERSLWLMQGLWRDVPVIYIRAHNMVLGNDAGEVKVGGQALRLAEKWQIPTVDLYNDSEMNTEDIFIRNHYTYIDTYNDTLTGDSIHPTAVGYAKYYLPPISAKMTELLSD